MVRYLNPSPGKAELTKSKYSSRHDYPPASSARMSASAALGGMPRRRPRRLCGPMARLLLKPPLLLLEVVGSRNPSLLKFWRFHVDGYLERVDV